MVVMSRDSVDLTAQTVLTLWLRLIRVNCVKKFPFAADIIMRIG
jgi:hypothetical protein